MKSALMRDEVKTERLLLRRPVAEDARVVFELYAQDPRVCRFMIWTPHTSEVDTRQFISSCLEGWNVGDRFPYIIAERKSNAVIGMIEMRTLGSTVDIGYVLAHQYWGNGYMPEAINTLTATVLAEKAFFRVQATCDVENIPSQRALEKSGFTREGRLERYTIHPNVSPEPRPCFMYAKCR